MAKKTKISEQDETLFRTAMSGIKPIQHSKVTLHTPKPVSTRITHKESKKPELDYFSDFEKLPAVTGDDILEYSRPGLQHKILRNLRNGKYNIEAILDLHGMTVTQARESLIDFISRCRKKGTRMVLIVHGKGRDKNKPILKNKLNNWLRQTEQVLAFCSATMKQGRGGALYVLLKAPSSYPNSFDSDDEY